MVSPDLFNLSREEAIEVFVRKKYDGYISPEIGIVIDLHKVNEIGEGIIIPGDGASYYETKFELFVLKPEIQEVVLGKIKDIADFGAFITIGQTEGMIHISQTMDDFVSFSKDKVLVGKETKRTLKVGDRCRARIIAVSFKDVSNPKLGLTMRQAGLGKDEWIAEDMGEEGTKKRNAKEKKKGADDE